MATSTLECKNAANFVWGKVSKMYDVLKYLDIFKIDRGIGYGLQKNCNIDVFCEAIDKPHATAIFLLCEGKVFAQLYGQNLCFHRKKSISKPNFESLGSVWGVRLKIFILKDL